MPINYNNYCKDWKLRSKFIRFYRAKDRCENCGVKNYSIRNGSRIVLTVAHLDHDIANNSFYNLMALCQKCHLNYDRKDNQIKEYLYKIARYRGNRAWTLRQIKLLNRAKNNLLKE